MGNRTVPFSVLFRSCPLFRSFPFFQIWKKDGQNLSELYSFTAFDGTYGANIAAGDIDGDGKAEVIVGTGPDPKNPAWGKVFRYDGSEIYSFISYPDSVKYGVKVSKGNAGN